MRTIQHAMADDHKRCDDLFTQAESMVHSKQWAQAEIFFSKFVQGMQRHFEHEEDILFPAFEIASGNSAGPTMMMRQEHQNMRELLEDLQQALNDRNSDRYLGLAETLLIFMQQHNMKEEQILYPMIDTSCEEQTEQLMQNFQNKSSSEVA